MESKQKLQERAAREMQSRLNKMIGNEPGASFAAFDEEKDAAIKAAIRLYVESWVLPVAVELADSLSQDKGQATGGVEALRERYWRASA